MKQYLSEIFFLLGKDRRKLVSLLILFLMSSLFELIGIGLIGPYLSIIVNPEGEIWKSFDNALKSINVVIPNQHIIAYLSLGLLITILIKSAMTILINFVTVKFSNLQNTKVRTRLMKSYQSYSYNLYLERNSSEYIQAALMYTGTYTSSLHKLIKMCSEAIITMVIMSIQTMDSHRIIRD